MGELQKIVGGADNRPVGAHLLESAQQKLAEAAALFNLPEHRLGELLAQPVRAFVTAGLDLRAHGLDASARLPPKRLRLDLRSEKVVGSTVEHDNGEISQIINQHKRIDENA
jgi:hypothetical protein